MSGRRRTFASDQDYWSFAENRLFKNIGARSFAFEADPSGTLLGGSHAFATARDWARFGQLFLQVRLAPHEGSLPAHGVERGLQHFFIF
jgi:CubicO group peptidase (beta-lactamase class C family)